MKNKRGDIPITILVIGTFLVCIYALVSFYLYNNKQTTKMIEAEIMENINSQIEKYNLYSNVGYNAEQISSLLNMQTDAIGRKYLYVESVDKDKKLITIKYYP